MEVAQTIKIKKSIFEFPEFSKNVIPHKYEIRKERKLLILVAFK